MGAWGYSSLECDEGQEVQDKLQLWIDEGYDYQEIADLFLEHWGDAINYGDSITNNEIIAVAELYLQKKESISDKLKKIMVDAINRELEISELERWDKPEERETFLKASLSELGGKRKKPKKRKFFSDPVLDFKSSDEAIRKLTKSFNKINSSKYPLSFKKAGFPSFISTLDRFINHRVCEKDTNIYIEARAQRLMMIATYLALNLNMQENELIELLQKIDVQWSKGMS